MLLIQASYCLPPKIVSNLARFPARYDPVGLLITKGFVINYTSIFGQSDNFRVLSFTLFALNACPTSARIEEVLFRQCKFH